MTPPASRIPASPARPHSPPGRRASRASRAYSTFTPRRVAPLPPPRPLPSSSGRVGPIVALLDPESPPSRSRCRQGPCLAGWARDHPAHRGGRSPDNPLLLPPGSLTPRDVVGEQAPRTERDETRRDACAAADAPSGAVQWVEIDDYTRATSRAQWARRAL